MRTNSLLKLHQKVIDILDMTVTCNNRIASKTADLARYKASPGSFFMYTEHDFTKEIERYTAIRNRLCAYYKEVLTRINNIVIKEP